MRRGCRGEIETGGGVTLSDAQRHSRNAKEKERGTATHWYANSILDYHRL